MKKIAVLLLSLSLVLTSLVGCGKDDESQGGVIVNAGDKSDTTPKEDKQPTEDVNSNLEDNNTNNNEEVENNTEDNTPTGVESLAGVWLDADENMLSLEKDGSFNAVLVVENKYLSGLYETDNATYITLKYEVQEAIKNPTEQDLILNGGYTYKSEELQLSVSNIGFNDDGTATITVNNVKMNLHTLDYIDESYDPDDTGFEEITDAAELERIRQELISQGINPDTGLSFKDEDRLRELGIDPLTGQPLVTEEEEENTEE